MISSHHTHKSPDFRGHFRGDFRGDFRVPTRLEFQPFPLNLSISQQVVDINQGVSCFYTNFASQQLLHQTAFLFFERFKFSFKLNYFIVSNVENFNNSLLFFC